MIRRERGFIMKKSILCLIIIICMLPVIAAAAKDYSASKLYFGEIPNDSIVLKPGDTIRGSSRISVEIYYADVNGKVVERGNGSVKSVFIDGEKVTEWKITETSGSIIQLGNMIAQGAFGYTLQPVYACADTDGYYTFSEKAYEQFKDKKDRKVKCTGTVIDIKDDLLIVSIAEYCNVAIKTDAVFAIDDRVSCKGKIDRYADYKNAKMPQIACEEISLRQYEPLQKGDAGEEVLNMKLRLQALGYFRASAELSDAYNDTCAERVRNFQQRNGLAATGSADAETLALLYSESAKPNE